MKNESHIVDDGILDKLDIPVDKGSLEYPKGLRELPSRVVGVTVDGVVDCLRRAAVFARKQLEEARRKSGV